MYMREAIALAKKGWGKTGINPFVGTVIVKDNKIVGRGFHRKIGEAHAEVCALIDAGKKAEGATLYVNLEPCCTKGYTPPCVEAIQNTKIKRVVIGMTDPNPSVNGKGINYLLQHNITITQNVLTKESEELNFMYKKYITKKNPYVILKIATSTDWKISDFKGKYITSEPSRRFVHSLRSQVSAIMVGINTILKDNPYLTDRLVGRHNPARVVIDPHLRIPLNTNFFDKNARRIIVTSEHNNPQKIEMLIGLGIEVMTFCGDYFPIEEVIKKLGNLDIGSILVEGGAILFSQILIKKLYDELYIFVSPEIAGGGLSIEEEISKELNLQDFKLSKIGEDSLYHVYRNN